jgi:hypothetical protein
MDPDSSTTLYEFVLSLHSIVRWAVIAFGVIALLQALIGVFAAGEPGTASKRLGLVFLLSLDIQVLMGIALHVFLSPVTKQGMQDMGAAMKDPTTRFWVVEHGLAMLVALVLVHVGRLLARRAKSERAAHSRRFVTTLLALALIGWATPWPFTAVERGWIRLPF